MPHLSTRLALRFSPRTLRCCARWFCMSVLCALTMFCVPAVHADTFPAQLLPTEVSGQEAEKEIVAAPTPGLLLIPHDVQKDTDDKYKQRYHAACYVYAGEVSAVSSTGQPVNYVRRFIVHAPEAAALPLIKRTAHFLLVLYGLNRDRLRADHAFHQTVDVWLSGQAASGSSPDIGGEQFKNQIYLYNIFTARRPVEWVRELAHEYGHYALPGVSGFKEPEEWANGVLGERLFLKWIGEDLKAGKIKPADVPFANPEEIEEYIGKQDTPLIRRIAREGILESQLTRKDIGAMDLYTGLALYVDTVSGTGALLSALTYTQPKSEGKFVQADDFLRGVQASIQGATDITYSAPLPAQNGKIDFWVYLPRGEFSVNLEGSAASWVFAADTKVIHPIGKNGILINHSAWRKLTLRFPDNAPLPARLVLHRKGTEVE